MHVDRVVIPAVAADEGEGVDSGDAGIVRRGDGGVTREGVVDEVVEERSRAEGAASTEEGCRHSLTLSLFSSHAAGDVNEAVEEVEGDEGGTWGEGDAVAGSEGNTVQDEGERVESDDAVGMVEEETGAGEDGAERGRRP